MRSVKTAICILVCAASLGGTVVLARHGGAQTLPPSAACVAGCAQGIGDCVSGAAASLQGCVAACSGNRPTCVQACGAGQAAAAAMCRADFDDCVAACPTS